MIPTKLERSIELPEVDYDVEWEFIVDVSEETNEKLVDRLVMYDAALIDLERNFESGFFPRSNYISLYNEQRMIYNLIKSEILLRMEHPCTN